MKGDQGVIVKLLALAGRCSAAVPVYSDNLPAADNWFLRGLLLAKGWLRLSPSQQSHMHLLLRALIMISVARSQRKVNDMVYHAIGVDSHMLAYLTVITSQRKLQMT